MRMTIQVAPDDCTGCGVCVEVCPAKSKEVVKHRAINMQPKLDHLEAERQNFEFFLQIPDYERYAGQHGDGQGDADSASRCLSSREPVPVVARRLT